MTSSMTGALVGNVTSHLTHRGQNGLTTATLDTARLLVLFIPKTMSDD